MQDVSDEGEEEDGTSAGGSDYQPLEELEGAGEPRHTDIQSGAAPPDRAHKRFLLVTDLTKGSTGAKRSRSNSAVSDDEAVAICGHRPRDDDDELSRGPTESSSADYGFVDAN